MISRLLQKLDILTVVVAVVLYGIGLIGVQLATVANAVSGGDLFWGRGYQD